jgi:hypothetical protein
MVNYTLDHRHTFANRMAHRHALPRYALVAAGAVALNALVLAAVPA